MLRRRAQALTLEPHRQAVARSIRTPKAARSMTTPAQAQKFLTKIFRSSQRPSWNQEELAPLVSLPLFVQLMKEIFELWLLLGRHQRPQFSAALLSNFVFLRIER
jgi:hypothetical protein